LQIPAKKEKWEREKTYFVKRSHLFLDMLLKVFDQSGFLYQLYMKVLRPEM
jgi:hypothetical protein